MAFHDFNSLQKELRDRGIDPRTCVVLTEIYVQHLEGMKQISACAKVIEDLVQVVSHFTQLHEATQGKFGQLLEQIRGGEMGVDVKSEAITDEDDYSKN